MNVNIPALRSALRSVIVWAMVAIGLVELVIGLVYGWHPLGVLATVASFALAAAIFRAYYRLTLQVDQWEAQRAAYEARSDLEILTSIEDKLDQAVALTDLRP